MEQGYRDFASESHFARRTLAGEGVLWRAAKHRAEVRHADLRACDQLRPPADLRLGTSNLSHLPTYAAAPLKTTAEFDPKALLGPMANMSAVEA